MNPTPSLLPAGDQGPAVVESGASTAPLGSPRTPDLQLVGRAVPEWIGSSPDATVPRRVRDRIFLRSAGRCHLTGRKIGPGDVWDLDHVKPLKDGGEHRETNLAPALKQPHIEKTAEENAGRAKEARMRAKHFGYFPKSRAPMRSRGFAKTRPGCGA